MAFKITASDSKGPARAGVISTPHGELKTPAFMPVATKGSVKTVSTPELRELGAEAIIANALHLHVRPGEDTLRRAGGLHSYMKWDRVLFTDSGGFQIIRKGFDIKINEDGLKFRDFFSGANRFYSPETCMDVQKAIGSDICMLLDDCPPWDSSPAKMKESAERTVRWAKSGLDRGRELNLPNIFVIVQGGTNSELRRWCSKELSALDPDGFGIGGLSIGEPKEQMMKTLEESVHELDVHKPRYLMGVGSVRELLDAIALGVDVFDSVFPTQCARHGSIFTRQGRLNMRSEKLNSDDRPLDVDCACKVCQTYSRSYINHLLREKEMLGMRLTSIHNLHFILDAVRNARSAIEQGCFEEFRAEWQ